MLIPSCVFPGGGGSVSATGTDPSAFRLLFIITNLSGSRQERHPLWLPGVLSASGRYAELTHLLWVLALWKWGFGDSPPYKDVQGHVGLLARTERRTPRLERKRSTWECVWTRERVCECVRACARRAEASSPTRSGGRWGSSSSSSSMKEEETVTMRKIGSRSFSPKTRTGSHNTPPPRDPEQV